MSYYIKSYEKNNDSYYNVISCNKKNICNPIEKGYYKIENHLLGSSNDDDLPFLTTSDKKLYFVPSRVAEDNNSDGGNKMLSSYLEKRSCWNIDPCTIHLNKHCCTQQPNPSTNRTDQESNMQGNQASSSSISNISFIIIMVTFCIAAFVILLASFLLSYFLARK